MSKRDAPFVSTGSNKRSSAQTNTSREDGARTRDDGEVGRSSRARRSSEQQQQRQQSPHAIQPNLQSSCPYEVLGVPSNATIKQIKVSYRKLALQYHPDRQTSRADMDLAHKNFTAIGHAYEILGDEARRSEYDDGLMQRQRQRDERRSQQRADDFFSVFNQDPFSMFEVNDPFASSFFGGRRQGSTSGFHFTDPFELFNNFFEQETQSMNSQRQRSSHLRTTASNNRMDTFCASDPFFSSGFGSANQMMSQHVNMLNSMMNQMQGGSMFGGFDSGFRQHHQLMGGGMNFMSSSSSSGGNQFASTSTRTSIVNGVRTTVTERVNPDGSVEPHVETSGGESSRRSNRLPSSQNYPALGYDHDRRGSRRL